MESSIAVFLMRQTAYEPLPTENTNANANANIMQILSRQSLSRLCLSRQSTEMQNTYNRNAHTNAQMQLTANLTTSATTINCFALLFSFDFFVC